MAETPVRFGIIEWAGVARKVARAINIAPDTTLHAIASSSLEKANQIAVANEVPGTIKIYGGYQELLDDPCVDVVYMPLLNSLHLQWAVLAAQKKKHLLLKKPTALDVAELVKVLEACERNGVQYMDGSMWLHHPRTAKLKEMINDPNLVGQVDFLHITSTLLVPVKPDRDTLGALGDLGWYCISAALWAKNYQLPTAVTALPDTIKNPAGVILSCTASLHFGHDKSNAIIHCSFLSNTSMDLTIVGKNGSVQLTDFCIPYQEDSAFFDFTLRPKFVDMHIGWNVKPEKIVVANALPQEALMVQELASIVERIGKSDSCLEKTFPEISRKTHLVMDAVKKSIDLGCKTVSL